MNFIYNLMKLHNNLLNKRIIHWILLKLFCVLSANKLNRMKRLEVEVV